MGSPWPGGDAAGGVLAARFTLVSPARPPPETQGLMSSPPGRPPSGRRRRAPPSRAFLRQGIPAPARGPPWKPVTPAPAAAAALPGPRPPGQAWGGGASTGCPPPPDAGGAGRGARAALSTVTQDSLRTLTLRESEVPSQRDAWASCPGGASGGSSPAACMPTPPGAGSCMAGGRCGLAWPWPALGRAGKPWPDSPGPVRSVWGGGEDVQPGPTRPGALACGRGAMTLSLFTVSPPVWELITVRTRRDGWKDEQIAVCL